MHEVRCQVFIGAVLYLIAMRHSGCLGSAGTNIGAAKNVEQLMPLAACNTLANPA